MAENIKLSIFTLSNCAYSGIDTVGVLTQYQPLELNSYIGTGASWDLDSIDGGVLYTASIPKRRVRQMVFGHGRTPFVKTRFFIDKFNPEYLLVLSGDHIYKMDYNAMLRYHIENESDATIAVIKVPLNQGIAVRDHEYGRVQTGSLSLRKNQNNLRTIWPRWAFIFLHGRKSRNT